MKITFDEQTKNALLKGLVEKNKPAVRLSISGFGWGGPTLSVALDEQNENDLVENIDGLTFVVDKDEEYIFEECTVAYRKTLFGETFKVVSAAIGESTCS